jgi:ketosteroid isomerase-like protein
VNLADRLAALEAEAAILRTLHRYGHAIDAGDEAAWVDLFTPDGEFQVRGPGVEYTIAGHTELAAFIARHSRRPEAFHEHVMVQPVIDVDGGRATCVSRFFVIVMDGERPVVRTFGTYHDALSLGADGLWRFVVRRPEIDAAAPGLPPLAFARES